MQNLEMTEHIRKVRLDKLTLINMARTHCTQSIASHMTNNSQHDNLCTAPFFPVTNFIYIYLDMKIYKQKNPILICLLEKIKIMSNV